LTFTGIDYAADIAGFLVEGDPAGSVAMAQDVSASVLVVVFFFILTICLFQLTNAASSCLNAS
jgi:hypothetical protein